MPVICNSLAFQCTQVWKQSAHLKVTTNFVKEICQLFVYGATRDTSDFEAVGYAEVYIKLIFFKNILS